MERVLHGADSPSRRTAVPRNEVIEQIKNLQKVLDALRDSLGISEPEKEIYFDEGALGDRVVRVTADGEGGATLRVQDEGPEDQALERESCSFHSESLACAFAELLCNGDCSELADEITDQAPEDTADFFAWACQLPTLVWDEKNGYWQVANLTEATPGNLE